MKIERLILFLPAAVVLSYSLLLMGHGAKAAAPPQAKTAVAAPAPAKAVRGTSPVTGAGAFSIPDTTLAVNSDKPMSERVVHYEINAKYDAGTHTVDATEVLT